ncbi:MAG TPA: HAMP domain-containing sensor histidine kinase [Chloroflexota bacterium]|nr:HAMP domain-containing sensor histidine kinase [Chloroflexota bacterium]
MSIRLRLTVWYAGLMALTLVLSSVILYLVLNQSMTIETDTFLESKARDMSFSLQSALRLPDLDRFAEGDVYAQLLMPDLRIVDESKSLGDLGEPLDPEAARLAVAGTSSFNTVVIRDVRVRVYTTRITIRGNQVRILQVGRSFERFEHTLTWLQRALLIGDLALVALATAVGWWMAGSSLRPIVRITRTVQSIGESQRLDQRVEYEGPHDEIGELVHTFNRMLAQLEASISAQRRFVADASHELRTPLTTLRLNIDLLRRDRTAEPPERAEVLDDIASELDRLSRLVQGLLDLARADAGFHLERQPVRADEIVLDVYHQVRPAADGVVINLGETFPITFYANPDYLKQLLLILLDNAIKYTDPGGQVRFTVERDGEWVKFQVSDTGRGIAPEDLPHIFERFYRSRGVRRQRGTGLGLAVARWIAEEHGGHIDVESVPGHGATFTVWLPAGDPRPPASLQSS